MALGDTRRKLRILSLTLAAQMIEDYVNGGVSHEEMGLDENEFEILQEENKKTALKLHDMAAKLDNKYET